MPLCRSATSYTHSHFFIFISPYLQVAFKITIELKSNKDPYQTQWWF